MIASVPRIRYVIRVDNAWQARPANKTTIAISIISTAILRERCVRSDRFCVNLVTKTGSARTLRGETSALCCQMARKFAVKRAESWDVRLDMSVTPHLDPDWAPIPTNVAPNP